MKSLPRKDSGFKGRKGNLQRSFWNCLTAVNCAAVWEGQLEAITSGSSSPRVKACSVISKLGVGGGAGLLILVPPLKMPIPGPGPRVCLGVAFIFLCIARGWQLLVQAGRWRLELLR